MKYLYTCILILLCITAYAQLPQFGLLDSARKALNNNNLAQYHKWKAKAEKANKKNHMWCGNGQDAWWVSLSITEAMYMDKTGNTDSAISILLPLALNRSFNGVNTDAIDTLKTILLHKYTAQEVKDEVTKAMSNIYLSQTGYKNFSIQIFGTTQDIYPMWYNDYYKLKYGINIYTSDKKDSLLKIRYSREAYAPYMPRYLQSTYFYKTMTTL